MPAGGRAAGGLAAVGRVINTGKGERRYHARIPTWVPKDWPRVPASVTVGIGGAEVGRRFGFRLTGSKCIKNTRATGYTPETGLPNIGLPGRLCASKANGLALAFQSFQPLSPLKPLALVRLPGGCRPLPRFLAAPGRQAMRGPHD